MHTPGMRITFLQLYDAIVQQIAFDVTCSVWVVAITTKKSKRSARDQPGAHQ